MTDIELGALTEIAKTENIGLEAEIRKEPMANWDIWPTDSQKALYNELVRRKVIIETTESKTLVKEKE